MTPSRAELRTIRALLAASCVALPVFGVLHGMEVPDAELSWGLRWMFSISALLALLASFQIRSQLWLRPFGMLFLCALQAWYILLAAQHGMHQGQVISIVLISALGVLLFRSLLGLGAFAALTFGLLLHVYPSIPSPAISLPLFSSTLVTVAGTLGLVSLSRRRLELELERRVEERTAALQREVEERRAAERAALEASQAKSKFLANMSHELRTPLNAILGYTELVLEELEPDTRTEVEPDLQRVRTSASHLLRLIDDVLDLSRVESGELEVRPEEIDVGALVAEVLEEGARAWPTHGNTVTVDIPAGTVVRTDRRHLRQIVGNLLSNAIKFTSAGSIRVETSQSPASLSLSVSDTGVGIPHNALGKLFTKFVQVDDTPTRRFGGTGLGLALSQQLADKLRGQLSVRSQLGVGSTFTLTLPVAR